MGNKARLPPPDWPEVWWRFAWRVVGIPLAVFVVIAIIVGMQWVTVRGTFWQSVGALSGLSFWFAATFLSYFMFVLFWIGDLWAGLNAANAWAILSPEEQAKALADWEVDAAMPNKPQSVGKAQS